MNVSKTIPNVDSSSLEIATDETLRVKDSGITTAKLADGSVTAAKKAALNIQESASCGGFSTSSTSFVDITNLSVTIMTNGRPVVVMFRPADATNVSAWSVSGANSSELKLLKDGVMVSGALLNGDGSGSASSWASTYIETSLAAGTYTFKAQLRVTGGSSLFYHYTLVAYEL